MCQPLAASGLLVYGQQQIHAHSHQQLALGVESVTFVAMCSWQLEVQALEVDQRDVIPLC